MVEVPSWIRSSPDAASNVRTRLDDIAESIGLGGYAISDTIVDLAIEGGWEGQGANAADEATTSTSSVFTSLANNLYSAGSVVDGFREKIDGILTDIETKERELAALEEDDDDDDDRPTYSGGIVGGVDQDMIERGRINGEIQDLIDDAIAQDYVYGSTISDIFDGMTRSILSLYGAGEMFPTEATGLPDILESEQITPPPGPSCAPQEGDKRLTIVGPIPPPWAGEEGGGMGFWDGFQMGVDGVGLIPAVGIFADGTNTVISLFRAGFDSENRGEHFANAGFSAVAMIPVVGWFSTGAKWGDNAYDASKLAGLADDIHDIDRVMDASEEALSAAAAARYGDLPPGYRIDPNTRRLTAPDGRYMDSMGRWRSPNGSFADNPLRDPDLADRPYVRKETRDTVWGRQLNENGDLVDVNGDPLDPDWVDLGHRPGFENWRLREKLARGEITWEQWKKISNDPNIYRYEDRTINRGHQDELPWGTPSQKLDDYIARRGWENP